MKRIQVYGPGCAKCASLAEVTKQAVKELQWDMSVEKVTDPMLFSVTGVLVTPALVVDGKVLVSGKVPPVEAVKGLLREADAVGGCCGSQKAEVQPEKDGGCCGGKSGAAGWRKAIVWIVVILIVLTVVKLLNRGSKEAPAPHTFAVPMMQGEVEAVYYQYGARCPTCIRMESWTKEAIGGAFAEALKEGKLVFRSIPADRKAVRKYGMTTKSLIVREWGKGKESGWQNLDRIWELNGDEARFKAYVVQEVRKKLDEVKVGV